MCVCVYVCVYVCVCVCVCVRMCLTHAHVCAPELLALAPVACASLCSHMQPRIYRCAPRGHRQRGPRGRIFGGTFGCACSCCCSCSRRSEETQAQDGWTKSNCRNQYACAQRALAFCTNRIAVAALPLPDVFDPSQFTDERRRSTYCAPVLLHNPEDLWGATATVHVAAVVCALARWLRVWESHIHLRARARACGGGGEEVRGAHHKDHRINAGRDKLAAGDDLEIFNEPRNGLDQASAFVVKDRATSFVKGWVHRDQCDFLYAAANLGRVFRGFRVTRHSPHDIERGIVQIAVYTLAKEELVIEGDVLCRVSDSEAVNAAVGPLVLNM